MYVCMYVCRYTFSKFLFDAFHCQFKDLHTFIFNAQPGAVVRYAHIRPGHYNCICTLYFALIHVKKIPVSNNVHCIRKSSGKNLPFTIDRKHLFQEIALFDFANC